MSPLLQTPPPNSNGQSDRDASNKGRAQTEVVAVALLLGITVISMGTLTLTIGTALDENAASVDANGVATDFRAAIKPVTTSGTREATVSFAGGTLRSSTRTMRLLDGSDNVIGDPWEIGVLIYERDEHRVMSIGGAVIHARSGYARFYDSVPVATSPAAILVGVVDLQPTDQITHGGTDASTLRFKTTVSHERTELGEDEYTIAIETTTPDPWQAEFERLGARTTLESFDEDEEPSVVARFDGERMGYVVTHEVELEVFHA